MRVQWGVFWTGARCLRDFSPVRVARVTEEKIANSSYFVRTGQGWRGVDVISTMAILWQPHSLIVEISRP